MIAKKGSFCFDPRKRGGVWYLLKDKTLQIGLNLGKWQREFGQVQAGEEVSQLMGEITRRNCRRTI